jgi:hypothetical protein
MKKQFPFTSEKHKSDRVVELIKADINKYVARERRKALPEGVDFWDFDCRCGATVEKAKSVNIAEIGKEIDKLFAAEAAGAYVEILAKPAVRRKKSEY